MKLQGWCDMKQTYKKTTDDELFKELLENLDDEFACALIKAYRNSPSQATIETYLRQCRGNQEGLDGVPTKEY